MFNMKGRARLEIELPSGITLVYDHESADGKAVPRWELMARMRAAIAATDFAAVQALYGEKPLVLDGVRRLSDGSVDNTPWPRKADGGAQIGGEQARPKPTTGVKKPTPTPATPPTRDSSGSVGAVQQPGPLIPTG